MCDTEFYDNITYCVPNGGKNCPISFSNIAGMNQVVWILALLLELMWLGRVSFENCKNGDFKGFYYHLKSTAAFIFWKAETGFWF